MRSTFRFHVEIKFDVAQVIFAVTALLSILLA